MSVDRRERCPKRSSEFLVTQDEGKRGREREREGERGRKMKVWRAKAPITRRTLGNNCYAFESCDFEHSGS